VGYYVLNQGFFGSTLYAAPCNSSTGDVSLTGGSPPSVSANCGTIANPTSIAEWNTNYPHETATYTGASGVAIDALGDMHEEAYIQLAVGSPGSLNPYYGSASAFAELVDYSTVTGPAGSSVYMNITYTMDGSVSEWVNSSGSFLLGYGSLTFDESKGIGAIITVAEWNGGPSCVEYGVLEPDTPVTNGTYNTGTYSVSNTVTCQVTPGEELFMETEMGLSAYVEANQLSSGYYTGNGGEEFNFGNTAGISSITFTDGSGNPVSGFGLSSTGGIAYDDIGGTPEPATLTLLGAGLGVLAFWKRLSMARAR
jgi:hypothetical protein